MIYRDLGSHPDQRHSFEFIFVCFRAKMNHPADNQTVHGESHGEGALARYPLTR